MPTWCIDGHAKNFSVFIEAQGGYYLTPLYDIISAHPLIASVELQQQKVKMAMALLGKNRHYKLESLQRRHFVSTAKAANFSEDIAIQLLDEMLDKVEGVIKTTQALLPNNFPQHISQPIFDGMLKTRERLVNSV